MTRSKLNNPINQHQGFHVFEVNQGGKSNFVSSNNELAPPNPNRTISLGNTLDDYQIVSNSNYPFALPLRVLIENSSETRRAKRQAKKGICKPPRPQNSFMLYRRHLSAKFKAEKMKAADRSKDFATMWREETEEVKVLFTALARIATERHNALYEDYKYRPNTARTTKNDDDSDTDFIQTSDSEFATNSEQSSPGSSFLDDPRFPIDDSSPTNSFPNLADYTDSSFLENPYFPIDDSLTTNSFPNLADYTDSSFLENPYFPIDDSLPTNSFPNLADCTDNNTVYPYTFEQLLLLQYFDQDQYTNEEPPSSAEVEPFQDITYLEDTYLSFLPEEDREIVARNPLSQPEVPFFDMEQTIHPLSQNSEFDQTEFI
ncbi:5484_t:CDS:2 [Funneliformis caledonium]|uniref:5484_t:CDS:1 n=1 Tax=Funneliformis caledonium TaxID=1117310 RepID=A0A9N9DB15_9GLOM|nr:5484_t:CDS:2 [Funneliformis caledonium]